MLVTDDFPQLRQLLWNRASAEIDDEEAFSLYEQNRAWVCRAEMNEIEGRFFDELVQRHGAGVFLG